MKQQITFWFAVIRLAVLIFLLLIVISALSQPVPVPGIGTTRIQAENYVTQKGMLTGYSYDEDRTNEVGRFDSGDSVTYQVNVAAAGFYKINYRIVTPYTLGQLKLKRGNELLRVQNIPRLGDYGSKRFGNLIDTVYLNAGIQTLTIQGSGSTDWAFNWFELSWVTAKNIYIKYETHLPGTETWLIVQIFTDGSWSWSVMTSAQVAEYMSKEK